MPNNSRNIVLLDLDGTLTDSAAGIIASVRETFKALNMSVPDDAELQRFIGPSIVSSFKRNHVPDDQIDRAVDIYRDFYAEQNIFDDPNHPGRKVSGRFVNALFDGIDIQLKALREDGYYLAVATCKPQFQAEPICERFGVTPLVDGIYGASRDNSRVHKDQVIRYCFEHIRFDAEAGDSALMVGDRWTDADGAKACGLDCLGCGWGYAETGELAEHGAYTIIERVSELHDAVNDYFRG